MATHDRILPATKGLTPVFPRHGSSRPPAAGLYDPAHEHDACGVGFVVDIKGRRSHAIVAQGAAGAR